MSIGSALVGRLPEYNTRKEILRCVALCFASGVQPSRTPACVNGERTPSAPGNGNHESRNQRTPFEVRAGPRMAGQFRHQPTARRAPQVRGVPILGPTIRLPTGSPVACGGIYDSVTSCQEEQVERHFTGLLHRRCAAASPLQVRDERLRNKIRMYACRSRTRAEGTVRFTETARRFSTTASPRGRSASPELDRVGHGSHHSFPQMRPGLNTFSASRTE